MTNAHATALNRTVEVHLDDGTIIRVATHGPHRVGLSLCIIVCAGDDDEMIRVTVGAAGAMVERGTQGLRTDQYETALGELYDGPCVACAVRDAVGRAAEATIPSDPTPQQVALIAALDELTRHMPGHEHTEETP